MCLQAVYETADDPAICDQLYLKGVRPNCRAYYASPVRTPLLVGTPLPAPTLTSTSTSPRTTPTAQPDQIRRLPSPDDRWTTLVNETKGSLDLEGPDGEILPIFPPGSTVATAEWSPDSVGGTPPHLLVVRRNWQWDEPGEVPRAEQPLQLWQVKLQDSEMEPPQMVFQSPVEPGEPDYLPEQLQFGHWSPDGKMIPWSSWQPIPTPARPRWSRAPAGPLRKL